MPEFGLCNTTASVSLCCLPGQICLSNGFCSTQAGQIYSGACTDPTYSSSICPEFCTFGICLAWEFCCFSLICKQQLVVTLLNVKDPQFRMGGFAAAWTPTEPVATMPTTSCTWPLRHPLQLLLCPPLQQPLLRTQGPRSPAGVRFLQPLHLQLRTALKLR